MATRVGVLDGGGPKDSENTLNSFLTKRDKDGFWQIGADMSISKSRNLKDRFTFLFDNSIFTQVWAIELWSFVTGLLVRDPPQPHANKIGLPTAVHVY